MGLVYGTVTRLLLLEFIYVVIFWSMLHAHFNKYANTLGVITRISGNKKSKDRDLKFVLVIIATLMKHPSYD